MASVTEVNLNAGDILYHQGDPNDSAYIVESGVILLFSERDGERIDCERRTTGCILGETSILTNSPRAVSVEAVTPCRLYRLSAKSIWDDFEALDPLLLSCVETTIDFVGRYNDPVEQRSGEAPFAPSTLRNSAQIIEKFKFELDIEKGIDRKEFHMAYQPIVWLETGKIAGFEALMRWQHPSMGNVRPDRFIEVAEETGCIGKLTEFALLESCGALRRFNDLGETGLFASVNVSGQDIGKLGFVDFFKHVLDLNDLMPAQVKLEVTETALVPDSSCAADNLRLLSELGCGISIDDFGTGYSNLAYLKTLPLTALKIDRAFAGDAFANSVSRTIVRMLVGLGRELRVDVIAEGLETEDDVRTLLELGCDFAQGYYFYKPMSETELGEILGKKSHIPKVVA
ncbi:hypothetical protein NBRC116601_12160 [Cognatishimia sp. WU-CL00825]|uniref:EAL domain-containing protein n=1 Tax=Cognatishimia sp. WU-CL00825 TaxID=3127658 RepID=UPI0031081DCC